MASAAFGALPFAEQLAFFQRKLNLPTTGWTDIYTREHDWAFVVAGANRDAIVSDFRAAVERAIADGTTLEDFRRDFDTIVAKHGWDYNGGRDWRSRVIYDTNLSTSYAAGRYEQLQAAPYWQYEHADWVKHPRELHLSWDGLVLAKDDPFWETHFPPNGWGCQCTVRGLLSRDLAKLGKAGPDQAPEVHYVDQVIGKNSQNPRTVRVPEGIDPGFEYAPGAARMRSAIPPEKPVLPTNTASGGPGLPNHVAADPLPPPRALPGSVVLPQGLASADYAQAFLAEFGADLAAPAVVRDVLGERLVVGKELFLDAKGNLKADKRGRGPFMRLLALALKDPDEVWARVEWAFGVNRAFVRRRYIARFTVEGEEAPALAVFELTPDGWTGVTTFAPEDFAYLEGSRVGVRLYKRP